MRAIDLENQQVRIEWIQVRLRRLHEHLRREPAECPVLDNQIRVGKPRAQIVGHDLPPALFGDGLPIEQNADRVALLRRARRQQPHRPLDVASVSVRVPEVWWWEVGGRIVAGRAKAVMKQMIARSVRMLCRLIVMMLSINSEGCHPERSEGPRNNSMPAAASVERFFASLRMTIKGMRILKRS